MAFKNKDLRIGDFLMTKTGEIYLYLGFYEGSPSWKYADNSTGYMYLFCDSLGRMMASSNTDPLLARIARHVYTTGCEMPPETCDALARGNLDRLRSGFDGNACYTAQYKKFECRVGHVDLSSVAGALNQVYGCRRSGDHRPRSRK